MQGRTQGMQQIRHAQVLDDGGIHPASGYQACGLGECRDFGICNQRIESDIDAYATPMAITDSVVQGSAVKIFRIAAGVESLYAQIYGICATAHSGT